MEQQLLGAWSTLQQGGSGPTDAPIPLERNQCQEVLPRHHRSLNTGRSRNSVCLVRAGRRPTHIPEAVAGARGPI